MRPSRETRTLCLAARKAARRLRADFGRRGEIAFREKGPADLVSAADIASQEILERVLRRAFPGHELVMEEGARRARGGGGGKRLLVDPLDGTTNFLHGIAHFSISIALQVGDAVVAGVVLHATSGELFYAEKGRGAWLDGKPPRRLKVSGETDLRHALVGTGIPHRGKPGQKPYLAALAGVMTKAAGIRRFGSAALDLAQVAAGRFEAFFERDLQPWDVAAGALLVTEAGGQVCGTDGRRTNLDGKDILAACNPRIQRALVKELAPLQR